MSGMNKGLFSGNTYEWGTPQELFNELNKEFGFTLDPCASKENHKCEKYYTINDDGLSKSWANEVVFMNPPYGRVISKWVEKAYMSARNEGAVVVCLLPARTDTRWFHSYIYNEAETEFLAGRLKFTRSNAVNGEPFADRAPFPNMIVIFR